MHLSPGNRPFRHDCATVCELRMDTARTLRQRVDDTGALEVLPERLLLLLSRLLCALQRVGKIAREKIQMARVQKNI